MARKKGKKEEELWRRFELTPEQKAEGRAELERQVEEARRKGVYEKLLAIAGTVDIDVEFYRRLREEDD